jgi:hypothetical protein
LTEIYSPSDFGFHNILHRSERLFFFDFEYSGKDHPIKLILDFLYQPEVNLSAVGRQVFLNELAPWFKNGSLSVPETVSNFFLLKWTLIIASSLHRSGEKHQIESRIKDYQRLHTLV